MEDYQYRIVRLMQRYLCGKLSPEESKELREGLEKSCTNRRLGEEFCLEELERREIFFQKIKVAQAFRRFERRIGYLNPWYRRYSMLFRYAAVVVLFVGTAFLVNQTGIFSFSRQTKSSSVISPGSYRALLTLADGRELSLDEGIKKEIPLRVSLPAISNGKEIVYADTLDTALSFLFNRLKTPRGGEYQVVLSDGSRVFLNAASELKYPVAFGTTEREVFLSGEAYFEIARDTVRPFYVVTDAARIRVYGTKFNVNTHFSDRMQAVLVQGQIGITGKQEGHEYIMRPAELSEFSAAGTLRFIRKVDTSVYIAWKTGRFRFDNKRLEEIMDDLSLWYNVDVFYLQAGLKELRFTGDLPRYEQVDVILNAIHRMTGILFQVKERTITVMK